MKNLYRAPGISRTRLYGLTAPYTKTGIAGYIREKRMLKAKDLLQNSGLSVEEISDTVEFCDCNSFCRALSWYMAFRQKNIGGSCNRR